jgi:hypothetical protein
VKLRVRSTLRYANGLPKIYNYDRDKVRQRFSPPGAGKICEDLPRVAETVATFDRERLALQARRRVPQQTCGSLRAFAERTRCVRTRL